MNRRTFLGTAVGLALAARHGEAAQTAKTIPIIDTHIHIYDPFRPGGTPWPNKDNKVLFQTSLPGRYKSIAQPLGIVGAIAVEASSWVEDNQWVLDVAQQDDIMVGTVGRLVPGTPEFTANLAKFRKNPLYRGIRYGLGRQGGKEFDRPEFIADLKALADADLVLDTANPSVPLLADVVRVSDRVPNLRVIIDHLPQMVAPTDTAARASYDASMKAFRERPQIYVKVSEVLRRVEGNIPTRSRVLSPAARRDSRRVRSRPRALRQRLAQCGSMAASAGRARDRSGVFHRQGTEHCGELLLAELGEMLQVGQTGGEPAWLVGAPNNSRFFGVMPAGIACVQMR